MDGKDYTSPLLMFHVPLSRDLYNLCSSVIRQVWKREIQPVVRLFV
jgi:hypothetical protein